MPRGKHPCRSCGELLPNNAKRCRHCGSGTAIPTKGGYLRVFVPGHPMASSQGYAMEHRWLLWEMAIPVPDGHHVHHINLAESDHHRLHIEQTQTVTNQYGTFPVLRDDQAIKERTRARNDARGAAKSEWRRRRDAAARATTTNGGTR